MKGEESHHHQSRKAGIHFGELLSGLLGEGYTAVAMQSLWEIRLYLFVRTEYVYHITNLMLGKTATGLGNVCHPPPLSFARYFVDIFFTFGSPT